MFMVGKKKKVGIYLYILFNVNGEKVVVFGLMIEDMFVILSLGKSIVFNDVF